MWLHLPGTLAVVALALTSPDSSRQLSIASLKANPAAAISGTVTLEGVVIAVRNTWSSGRVGIYRLADSSDPAGVLVRTRNLPADGGTFRVTAHMAARQLEFDPILEEVGRTRVNRPLLPIAALALSAIALVGCGALARRAMELQRHDLMAQPVWLLPHALVDEDAAPAPGPEERPLKYNRDTELADLLRHEGLKRRTRKWVGLTGVAGALSLASAFWLLTTRTDAKVTPVQITVSIYDSIPAGTALSTTDALGEPRGDGTETFRTVPLDTGKAIGQSTAVARADSSVTRPQAKVVATAPPPVAPASPPPRSSAPARQIPPVTAPGGGSPSRGTTIANPPPAASRIVATNPPPPPPPAPPPVIVASPPPAPTPVPEAPPVEQGQARTAESDRSQASAALQDAVARLADAINDKRNATIAQLLPESSTADASRRTKLFKLVKDFDAQASVGQIESIVLTGERGEGKFSLALNWRGDFGVTYRKTATFIGVMRHSDAGWRFDGARMLNDL